MHLIVFTGNNPKESINLVGKQPGGAIIQDHLGNLWVGTYSSGVYKLDIANNKLTHYKNDPNDSSSLSSDHIGAIIEDSFGTIWVGTMHLLFAVIVRYRLIHF